MKDTPIMKLANTESGGLERKHRETLRYSILHALLDENVTDKIAMRLSEQLAHAIAEYCLQCQMGSRLKK